MPILAGEVPVTMSHLPPLSRGVVKRIAEAKKYIGPAVLQLIGAN
jgi:hypothetical protein